MVLLRFCFANRSEAPQEITFNPREITFGAGRPPRHSPQLLPITFTTSLLITFTARFPKVVCGWVLVDGRGGTSHASVDVHVIQAQATPGSAHG
ncbi:hypothetical protein FB451DRAFT_1395691 [Mycena latifolia]|nr:hypothetical protein FB451DRAFT_1395691 [Mycena latifolia]